MKDVYAIPITTFDKVKPDYDADGNEIEKEEKGFIEVVDDLIKNKADLPFRFIVIDTITALERYAVQYVLKKASRENGKRYQDVSDIAYGKAYNMIAEEIYNQIDRLKKSGLGVFTIGHSKTKKITNRDGFEYDYTTFNVLTKTSDIIEREADMIIYGDMLVEKGEDGKATTARKLKFRSDGNILCGTRFRNFPDEIDLNANLFVETFKEAVLGLYDGDKNAVEVAKKEQQEEAEKKVFIEESTITPEQLHTQIKSKLDSLKDSLTPKSKKELGAKFKELLGAADYTKSDDVEKLQEALEHLNTI